MSLFPQFIDRVLAHEGGFTDHRADPGNWTGGAVGKGALRGTKWGISAASYPSLDIRALTREQAKSIYFRDFWERSCADELPAPVAFQALDAAINHGIGNAVRWVQRAAGVADDGKVGPRTLEAVHAADPNDLLMRFNAERLDFYTRLAAWPTFGQGWARRVAQNLRYGASDN